MNILVVDDERMPLEYLTRTLESVFKDAKITGFRRPSEALEYARSLKLSGNKHVDLAFLDIEMGGMNGLQLAKNLKDVFGKVNIIFTTGYSQYAADAYALHACGYLLKPISAEAVTEAMGYLHHPVTRVPEKKIFIKTFGNFEVFADNEPLKFSRSKTKELLAYLVMRNGAFCSNSEIIAVIWESKTETKALQNQFRHLIFDLRHTLENAGAEDILVKQRGALAIKPDKVKCDMFDFLAADTGAVNKYMGEFMAQYSWAEFTNAYLEQNYAVISKKS